MKLRFGYSALILLLFIFACKKDVGKVVYGDYPTNIGLIINNSCAITGCHDSKSYQAAAGFNLTNWSTMFSGSTSGSPVVPYSTRFSSLCYYINTFSDLGVQNAPTMPLNGKTLSHSDVKIIEDWINSGAPDINRNVKWADNSQRKKLYAVNQGCDIVTVFDSETQLPMRFIPVGRKPTQNVPHMIRVSPDGNYWYVVFINDNVMQKFRCNDDSYVGAIPLTPAAAGTGIGDGQEWNSFVITRDGKRAYCASLDPNGKVCCVDLENMKLLHYFTAQYNPHGIVLNATEDTVYVATQYGNFMTKIDSAFSSANVIVLQTGAPPNTSNTSLNPHDMILSPNNTDIFITCQNSNEVRVYNIPSNKITQIIQTGVYPQEIVYSKGSGQYFVSCTEDTTTFSGTHGVVTRINAADYSTNNIACGFQPHGIAVDEAQNLLYVLSRNVLSNGPAPHHTSDCGGGTKNGFVNFIDLNTFTLLPKRYELSADPYFIFTRP